MSHAGSDRCGRAIVHIRSTEANGNFALAKMLVDFAADDAEVLGCNDDQLHELKQLLVDIYTVYAVDHLQIAKDELRAHKDGRKAYHNLVLASAAAYEIGLELKGLRGTAAMALFTWANQLLDEADDAEQEGDVDRARALRDRAAYLLQDALNFDPRIKTLMQKARKP